MTNNEVVICLCFCVFSVGGYLVWPSRWNILAHVNAGFCIVAYVVPLLFLHQDRHFNESEIESLRHVMVVGAVAFVPSLLFGSLLARSIPFDLNASRAYLLSKMDQSRSARRLAALVILGIVFTGVAAYAMGGLPLFSSDPLQAKYFRGAAAISGRVSIVYRLGTCILTVLPPLTIAMMLTDRARRLRWLLLSVAAITTMIASLQRGPMAHGALLAVVVALVFRRRNIVAAMVIVGTFCIGAVFYVLLNSLGIGTIATGSHQSFLGAVAAGAPDVTDTLTFLRSWWSQGSPLTHGNTMWGGLVPGHYHWNSAVWSLTTENYGADINTINSGGLRLPTPVWGLVSFGAAGVWSMSALVGLIYGFLTKRFGMVISENKGVLGVVVMTMLLSSLYATAGSISNLSYLDVLNLGILLWVLWPSLSAARADRSGVRPGGYVRPGRGRAPQMMPPRRSRVPVSRRA